MASFWASSVLALVAILLLGSSGTTSSSGHQVRYEVSGTASTASITIENEYGGTEQHTVTVPWEKQFQAKTGQFVYVSAHNGGYGRIKAVTYVVGEMLHQAESTEQFGIASASGRVR